MGELMELKKLNDVLRKSLPIYEVSESYNFAYPEFADSCDDQIVNNHWTWKEILVEKDKQDFLVELTASEKFATTFFLKIFTKYELIIGDDFWAGRVLKMFNRPEIKRKAIFNSHQELNVHAPFYNELNKQLGLTSDEFYESYLLDNNLRERIAFVNDCLNSPSDLIALAAFTFLECAVIYSSFAFFKHFQMNGKNKLGNVVSGTDMSVLDENNHSIDSSNLYKIIVREAKERGLLSEEVYKQSIVFKIYQIVEVIKDHEFAIIDHALSQGEIEGITKHQMKQFVLLRLNEGLTKLGLEAVYHVTDHTIYEWFKNTTELYTSNDTFAKKGREYTNKLNKSEIYFREDVI